MGEYEDLIQQVRDGDAEALDTLETQFGGSTLREKAELADSLQKQVDKAAPFVRQARFSELVDKLDDSLKESGLTAEDFGDVDPSSLSLEMVRDKASARLEASQASRQAIATDAGFDTVEEYEEALTAVKERKTAKVKGMEAVTSGVASSGGQSGEGGEPTRFEKSHEAFKEAKTEGKTDDLALAAFIDVNLSEQSEPVEE